MCLGNSPTSICQIDPSYLGRANSRLHLAAGCVDKILDAAITQGIAPSMLSTDPDFVVDTLAPVACLYIDDYPPTLKLRAKFVDSLRFAFRQAIKFNRLPPSLFDHRTQRHDTVGTRGETEASKSTSATYRPVLHLSQRRYQPHIAAQTPKPLLLLTGTIGKLVALFKSGRSRHQQRRRCTTPRYPRYPSPREAPVNYRHICRPIRCLLTCSP